MTAPLVGEMRVLYVCTMCVVVYEDNNYNLEYMYGIPRVCEPCELGIPPSESKPTVSNP